MIWIKKGNLYIDYPAPDSPDERTDLGHFPSPDGICYMDGYIYVVEEQNNRVCGLTNFGDTFTVFGDNNGSFTLNKPGGKFFLLFLSGF